MSIRLSFYPQDNIANANMATLDSDIGRFSLEE